jgi:hypothetical protein
MSRHGSIDIHSGYLIEEFMQKSPRTEIWPSHEYDDDDDGAIRDRDGSECFRGHNLVQFGVYGI